MRVVGHEMDIGDTIIINGVRMTLEKKSGRRARFALFHSEQDRLEFNPKQRDDEKVVPQRIE